MGVPTTQSTPLSSMYVLYDDSGTTAGPAGGATGGASYQPLSPQFTAPNIAAAVTVAYLFSSIFQRPVRLAPLTSAPPYTLITGAPVTTSLTSVPSGVLF